MRDRSRNVPLLTAIVATVVAGVLALVHTKVGALPGLAAVGGREVPVSRAATLVVDVLGKNQLPRISAADVLSGKAPREALAGKLVFVGLTYLGLDKIATPLERLDNGVELHATLAENLLGGRLLRSTGDGATLLATLLLCGIVCAAQLRRVRRRSRRDDPRCALRRAHRRTAARELGRSLRAEVEVILPMVYGRAR